MGHVAIMVYFLPAVLFSLQFLSAGHMRVTSSPNKRALPPHGEVMANLGGNGSPTLLNISARKCFVLFASAISRRLHVVRTSVKTYSCASEAFKSFISYAVRIHNKLMQRPLFRYQPRCTDATALRQNVRSHHRRVYHRPGWAKVPHAGPGTGQHKKNQGFVKVLADKKYSH
jgi:hypothetical protein